MNFICYLCKMKFDSKEELYFTWWLDELKDNGYVSSWKRGETIQVLPKAQLNINGKLKHFLYNLEYTPDFEIKFTNKSDGVFLIKPDFVYKKIPKFYFIGNMYDFPCLVDVKGTFNGLHNNSAITFPIIQKILFNQGIIVQKIMPLSVKGLFAKTFTPIKYLTTEITQKARKIEWNIKSLNEYVKI